MISQVMCLHICYWGSMHTDSIYNAVSYRYENGVPILLFPICSHNDTNMDNGTLNDWQNGVGFGGFESKSRIEFVSNVIETYQRYNCGHYQDKHTKESCL